MARKKQNWKAGDTFMVPLADSSFAPGHVIAQERQAMNSVSCAFYQQRLSHPTPVDLATNQLVACLLTTDDLLDNGEWCVVGHARHQIPKSLLPYEHTRRKGWIGAKIIGSGVVVSFLNAFHGLAPWDDWADPFYLDKLLIHPCKKPASLVLSRNI